MITVKIYSSNDTYNGFEISGHADFAEYGKDIVCAAVSALAINTVNSIEQLTEDNPNISEGSKDGGYLKCTVDNPTYETEILFNSFVIGMISIYEQYGNEYLRLVY